MPGSGHCILPGGSLITVGIETSPTVSNGLMYVGSTIAGAGSNYAAFAPMATFPVTAGSKTFYVNARSAFGAPAGSSCTTAITALFSSTTL